MRKEKMKVYHGLPKSVTDKHTIFYADFDGSMNPKIGSATADEFGDVSNFLSTTTGYGIYCPSHTIISKWYRTYTINGSISSDVTVDVWLDYTNCADGNKVIAYLSDTNKSTTGRYVFYVNTNEWHFYNFSTLQDLKVVSSVKIPKSLCHIRVRCYSNKVAFYLNGVIVGVIDNGNLNLLPQMTKVIVGNLDSNSTYYPRTYADLHVSNIDRGDYFPNLPQDFIEGKAIVKPRMGQQQIKGDPMYSQVTELKVPHQTDWSQGYYDRNGNSLINPEMVCSDSRFARGSVIKIKGLNGEIISGVIDTDTALCKVMKELPLTLKNVPTVVNVDTTTALSVDDTVSICYADTMSSYPFLTINEIISDTEVKVTSTQDFSINMTRYPLLIESTASSSSPVVKTLDGTNVVGTWSGLGTNEATFTLGENTPSLEGKDLYATYALTMPSGNSDFPELPYSVDVAYNELGTEMKPVSEIIISDDFKGKIHGSTKECPHKIYFGNSTTLIPPGGGDDLDKHAWGKTNINQLGSLDGESSAKVTSNNGQMAQQIFSFNLIEMVERKLGCEIPSRDKVQWLKNNVTKILFNHYGYGTQPTGYLLAVFIGANYTSDGGLQWQGELDHPNHSHRQSKVTKLTSETLDGYASNKIDPNGLVNYLVHTRASNGTVASTVHTDYVSLEVKLKVDSTYTHLYCENKRAREEVCNPVLIQKETKTVKRYLPSKEAFATECKYSKPKPSKNTSLNSAVTKSDFVFLSTLGSGSYGDTNEYYNNCVNRLGVSDKLIPHLLTNDIIKYADLLGTSSPPDIGFRFYKTMSNNFKSNPYDAVSVEIPTDKRCVYIKPYLCNRDGELKLEVVSGVLTDKKLSNEGITSYSIKNAPLIK